MSYDLKDIANIEDEIHNINGKTFSLKMLTIRQRLKLDKILKDTEKIARRELDPTWWERFLDKIFRRSRVSVFDGKKGDMDFLFIKTCLDFCNPKQPLTEEDWLSLTTPQTAKLLEIIMEKNYFFDLGKLEEGVGKLR